MGWRWTSCFRLAGGLVPVEIKLTATPTPKHAEVLGKFKSLTGPSAAPEGVLVCNVSERTALTTLSPARDMQEFPGKDHPGVYPGLTDELHRAGGRECPLKLRGSCGWRDRSVPP
jgi:hypothetical protein